MLAAKLADLHHPTVELMGLTCFPWLCRSEMAMAKGLLASLLLCRPKMGLSQGEHEDTIDLLQYR